MYIYIYTYIYMYMYIYVRLWTHGQLWEYPGTSLGIPWGALNMRWAAMATSWNLRRMWSGVPGGLWRSLGCLWWLTGEFLILQKQCENNWTIISFCIVFNVSKNNKEGLEGAKLLPESKRWHRSPNIMKRWVSWGERSSSQGASPWAVAWTSLHSRLGHTAEEGSQTSRGIPKKSPRGAREFPRPRDSSRPLRTPQSAQAESAGFS